MYSKAREYWQRIILKIEDLVRYIWFGAKVNVSIKFGKLNLQDHWEEVAEYFYELLL